MMALKPRDEAHALQIQAGVLGRRKGHEFEDGLTGAINAIKFPFAVAPINDGHLFQGDPAVNLLSYIANRHCIRSLTSVIAISTGALATSEDGKKWLSINGASVSRCKSDIVLTVTANEGIVFTVGLSVKQCDNNSPTNAQLYFTTARGFANLLKINGIQVTDRATDALRQFCGEKGFQPLDEPIVAAKRVCDPRRWFWEEIDGDGRAEWESILTSHQDFISTLLLEKAYIEDAFTPDYLLHKTRKAPSWAETEVALYSMEELVTLSRSYQGFQTKAYSVRKGTYKDPVGVTHLAPRFGVIQMQRGGQKQHPEQLQFNLEAGYFYKLRS